MGGKQDQARLKSQRQPIRDDLDNPKNELHVLRRSQAHKNHPGPNRVQAFSQIFISETQL